MQLQHLIEFLTDETLTQLFSDAVLTRGRGYVTRVRQITVAGTQIQAQVQGSADSAYRTTVRLSLREYLGERELEINSRCSCPVGGRCKHAVALLLAIRRPGAIVEKPREQVLEWVRQFHTLAKPDKAAKPKAERAPGHALYYIFDPHSWTQQTKLHLVKQRLDRNGAATGKPEYWYNVDQALLKQPAFVTDEDLPLLRLIREVSRKAGSYWEGLPLTGSAGWALAQAVLARGHALLRSADSEDAPLLALRNGAPRPGTLCWTPDRDGLRARIVAEPTAAFVVATTPPFYIDAQRGEAGLLQVAEPEAAVALLRLPALTPSEIPLVSAALAESSASLPKPDIAGMQALPVIDVALQPVLTLATATIQFLRKHRGYSESIHTEYDYGIASFHYGAAQFSSSDPATITTLPDGSSVQVKRRADAEAAALQHLRDLGFAKVNPRHLDSWDELPGNMLGLDSLASWQQFFAQTAPLLREQGWRIDVAADFRHHVLAIDQWFAELDESANGWFELSLGIEVDGQRLDLAPLLYALFRQDARWLDPSRLGQIQDNETIDLFTAEGGRIRTHAGRIKPLALTLVELFDSPASGPLRVAQQDAPRLAEVMQQTQWQTRGSEHLDAWLARIRQAQTIKAIRQPKGLGLKLRPYQREGLAWLQHLRTHKLGGILADDMGLGKTAQALAHLLVEKHAGRLDRPVLAVLPTSLVFNWANEAQRFAPDLRVLRLQGKARAEAFAQIPEHDLCLTTYPLLWRDKEQLAQHEYHYIILDEAQTVKNAASQAAQVVRELSARHRLCITGTPLENHLGELWSQFDFLLPGFLGDAKEFTRLWRTPIEKQGNALRREVLARRIAPFILRRRKEDVAKELPPKTIVVRNVSLEGRQRDLYETVRASMDKRVRDEIAQRGFARSQIVILDALLKLRQVCCDPRLLHTAAAAKVKERAKLDMLMEMLPELIDEGRRILLFSQFTGMLALIGEELAQRGQDFALLTGDTEDREAQIRRFQEGQTPLFLISLKAGGVGLNLTAADTVIHYDPWWNPAVENQATDRAHRLGQTKNVFVYKLVVQGSIEEKILAMQERKAELAASILGEDASAIAKFGEADIQALLAPLPD